MVIKMVIAPPTSSVLFIKFYPFCRWRIAGLQTSKPLEPEPPSMLRGNSVAWKFQRFQEIFTDISEKVNIA